MQRREFLKLSGAALGSALLVAGLSHGLAALPVEVVSRGKHFRGYRSKGDIFVSDDAGETWQLHSSLGSQYSIDDLFVDAADQIHARVGFMHYQFQVFLSEDGKRWKTS